MNIGIVTTWFERGAAYVSRQYMEVLQREHNVFIYARSGESYAKGNPEWDLPNVYWSKKIDSPFTVTVIDKKEWTLWVERNKIEIILFNEQHWWEPLIWCKEKDIKTIAYIDYYTEQTVPLFGIYDYLICNTKKHFEAFDWHSGARYIPWGTDINLFKPLTVQRNDNDKVLFFHSCGMNPRRKGTDLLLKAIPKINNNNYKLIIHTQVDLITFFPEYKNLINELTASNKLEIIHKTIKAPGLYHLGDVYVYPSRLEGLGLTVAEALSCGLPVIVPDCGPMNEFVEENVSSIVKVEKLYSRLDGYYWPQNEVNVEDLALVMIKYIQKERDEIIRLKDKSRNYAEKKLDWSKNSSELFNVFNEEILKENDTKENTIKMIQNFEKYGLRKYNRYFLKFSWLFNLKLKRK